MLINCCCTIFSSVPLENKVLLRFEVFEWFLDVLKPGLLRLIICPGAFWEWSDACCLIFRLPGWMAWPILNYFIGETDLTLLRPTLIFPKVEYGCMDLFGLFILTMVPTGACTMPCLWIIPIYLPWKSLSGVVARPYEKLLYRFLFSEVVRSWSNLNLLVLWCSTPESCYVAFSPDLDLDLQWFYFLLSGESLLAKLGLELSRPELASSGYRYFLMFSKVCSFFGRFPFYFSI